MAEVPAEDVGAALLIAEARAAAAHAHAPYSRFGVGAAVLLNDGAIVVGTNFENASYGLSLCAETVALAQVNALGRLRDVVAVGVIGGRIAGDGLEAAGPVRPCGRCRQVIHEAASLGGRPIVVYCADAAGGSVERHLSTDLLPHAFGPADLGVA
jgi:cytidine deaminase